MKRILFHFSCLALLAVMPSAGHGAEPGRDAFVRVNPSDARYCEQTVGRPFIPVGFVLSRTARTERHIFIYNCTRRR